MMNTMTSVRSTQYDAIKQQFFQPKRMTLSDVVKSSPKSLDYDDNSTAATEPIDYSLEMRCVRFNASVTVRNTTALSEYTEEEIENCWFTSEEYDQIKHSMDKQIRKMNRGEKLKDKKYCSRGLECFADEAHALRQEYKGLAVQAVLDEQYCQFEEGINDEYTIAAAYQLVSKPCLRRAQRMGLADQRAVQQ